MFKPLSNLTHDIRVSVTSVPTPYSGLYDENIVHAVKRVSELLGWGRKGRGAFGHVVEKGSRIVVKPNFVLHRSQGNGGIIPLITHPSLVVAVVDEVLKADPAEVLVGDAPVQGCDYEELLQTTGLAVWARQLSNSDSRFKGIVDFRRTVAEFQNGIRYAHVNMRAEDKYVLVNLGAESLLDPLTDEKHKFRVTCYDPRLMAKTHSPGNHQYLIAKEILEADVVVNLPKLKTHKKAGVTGALKNLVGINGNKEYLPHHRVGGTASGGDCYPGRSPAKWALESALDLQNMAASMSGKRLFSHVVRHLERAVRLSGDRIGVEGSWIGNQTVPRMTLDLNRILLYGRVDGTLDPDLQRRVLNIVDAVVAGEGEGPLAPDAVEMGLIFAGQNPAAVDWFGAEQLGYEACKIPSLDLAFHDFTWPIAHFAPGDIQLIWSNEIDTNSIRERANRVKVPVGWVSAKLSAS